jgi:hypothetical protein
MINSENKKNKIDYEECYDEVTPGAEGRLSNNNDMIFEE